MLIYQPNSDAPDEDFLSPRVVWYGGESTMLHFQIFLTPTGIWETHETITYSNFPEKMSDMVAQMEEYYYSVWDRNQL